MVRVELPFILLDVLYLNETVKEVLLTFKYGVVMDLTPDALVGGFVYALPDPLITSCAVVV
jgi:hypothetical protein